MDSPSPANPLYCRYSEVRDKIHSGYLLLWRPTNCSGRVIAKGGRSIYSHASMADWWNEDLFNLETLQGVGGQAMLLSNLVKRWPGIADVYAVSLPSHKRLAACRYMRRRTGIPYGRHSLLWHVVWALPGIRWLVPSTINDDDLDNTPVCSQLISESYRIGAATDPIPNLSDWGTTPGDLSRWSLAEYKFTLISDK